MDPNPYPHTNLIYSNPGRVATRQWHLDLAAQAIDPLLQPLLLLPLRQLRAGCQHGARRCRQPCSAVVA